MIIPSPDTDTEHIQDTEYIQYPVLGDSSCLVNPVRHYGLFQTFPLSDMNDDKPLVSTLAGRRYMVINEIISTETKYINNLNTILSIFLPAFEHVVAPRDLRLLIPAQLEMLVESHQEILNRLKQRVDNKSKFYGIVGDIFARLCDSNVRRIVTYRITSSVA